MKVSKLEDFGMTKAVPPWERKLEYARQCKELPKTKQAKFWFDVMARDPEVAKLVVFKRSKA